MRDPSEKISINLKNILKRKLNQTLKYKGSQFNGKSVEEMIKEAPKEYDPTKKEEEIQDFWNSEDIYNKVKEEHQEDPDWYFLDGPPYASGRIHLGTAWNKLIKDTVLRFQTMKGYDVRRQPGWDTHGLPIEVKVEEELDVDSKKDIEQKYGIEKFIDECKKWANEHIDVMTDQFKRLGVWMDWDDPYITYKNDYLESAWWTLKNAAEKDLLEQRLQVIQWCPRCETALADHEVRGEYKQVKDPSMFAKFKLTYSSDEYLLVWTTTPWTIPANMAVSVHPDLYYAKVEVDGETYIMAEALVSDVMSKLGIYNYKRVGLVKGEELEGLKYEHPMLDEVPKQNEFKSKHQVITGEHVTIEEGTGCVHTAPGHGVEDFEIGEEYDLPVFSPVGEDGKFTEEAGEYEGLYVKDADDIILGDLKEKGILMNRGKIRHSYPHCWRCDSPLIFRATDQWFLDISGLKSDIIEKNNEKVEWTPEWAKDRYNDGVESVGDWCVSRQRYWGIPIPIWECENCENSEIIGDRQELFERSKEDLPKDIDLHRPGVDGVKFDCSNCGGEMSRIEDVLDVWFDSGIAPWASLGFPKDKETKESLWPCEFITEGEDQITKWFYSQQAASVISFEDIPYREAAMHGFTLDNEGRKMSKSLGNVVEPSEVIEKYGADALRFYMLHTSPIWEDLKFDWDELEVAERLMNVLWNSFVFGTTYMSIDNFDPNEMSDEEFENHLEIEDEWLLSKTNRTIKEVTKHLENKHFHKATRALESYILEDMSRWYIKLVRRRTWIKEDDPKKESAYQTLYRTFDKLLRITSPLLPHLSEEMYQKMIKAGDKSLPESVHQLSWPEVEEDRINEELEEDMKKVRDLVETGAKARQRAGIKGRWPVKKVIISTENENTKNSVQRLNKILIEQLNCKKLEVFTEEEFKEEIEFICEVDTDALEERFDDLAYKIEKVIKNMKTDQVKKQAENQGFVGLTVEGQKIKVGLNELTLDKLPDHLTKAESEYGNVIIDGSTNEDLEAERLTRDIVRRLQEMRKDMELEMEEKVDITISVDSEKFQNYLEKENDYIKEEVRVNNLEIGSIQNTKEKRYKKKWDIMDEHFELSISRT